MKIIQLIQKPQLRGAEMFASQLSSHLSQLGHEVILVPIYSGNANMPFEGKVVPLNRSLNKRFWDWQGWKQFAKIVKEEKPDIIQANAADTLKFAIFSRLFFAWKVPVIFRNASTISHYITNLIVKVYNAYLLRKADYVISVSELSRTDINNIYPFTQKKIKVIPVGINFTAIGKVKKNNSAYIVTHVGGFTVEKNHEGLLRIFDKIKSKHDNALLWLIGDGDKRAEIEQMVKVMGLEQYVEFFGYQTNPMDYVAVSDVLVLPSKVEGTPGVILEAQYCKTPVIAYDVGGVPELIHSSDIGWLIKKDDEIGFVNALEEVLEGNKEEIKVICNNAYQQVLANYDNKIIAKKFEAMYKHLLTK